MELAPLARELVLVLDEDEGGGPRVDGHAPLGVRRREGPMGLVPSKIGKFYSWKKARTKLEFRKKSVLGTCNLELKQT